MFLLIFLFHKIYNINPNFEIWNENPALETIIKYHNENIIISHLDIFQYENLYSNSPIDDINIKMKEEDVIKIKNKILDNLEKNNITILDLAIDLYEYYHHKIEYHNKICDHLQELLKRNIDNGYFSDIFNLIVDKFYFYIGFIRGRKLEEDERLVFLCFLLNHKERKLNQIYKQIIEYEIPKCYLYVKYRTNSILVNNHLDIYNSYNIIRFYKKLSLFINLLLENKAIYNSLPSKNYLDIYFQTGYYDMIYNLYEFKYNRFDIEYCFDGLDVDFQMLFDFLIKKYGGMCSNSQKDRIIKELGLGSVLNIFCMKYTLCLKYTDNYNFLNSYFVTQKDLGIKKAIEIVDDLICKDFDLKKICKKYIIIKK